jgi:ribosomal protein S18 acetylase RimI-like enzyme
VAVSGLAVVGHAETRLVWRHPHQDTLISAVGTTEDALDVIVKLAVTSRFQRRHIGRALLDATRTPGRTRVVELDADATGAINLCVTSGVHPTGETERQDTDGNHRQLILADTTTHP